MSSSTFLVAVTSDATEQPDQDNRSSGNFSTEGAPAGTKQLQFFVDNASNDNYASISFNVMLDKSAWIDPVVYKGVKSGDKRDYQSERSFYIANPSGTGGNKFVVNVYAVT